MSKFLSLFGKPFPIIAMIHVGALPGTPLYRGCFEKVVENARKEAEIYQEHGVDGILIENMHDIPYIRPSDGLGPEVTAAMARVTYAVRETVSSIPCGVQILAGCNREALAVAKACKLQFIRAEGFVFGHMADEGFTDACAGSLLRYRKQIDAEDVLVLTDIKKKHSSHAITNDVSIGETAHAAEFFLSDGLVITGASTGASASEIELRSLAGKTNLPLIIGSGLTLENFTNYRQLSHGAIVGSHFKSNGHWAEELCPKRIKAFMNHVKTLREQAA
ncbi:AGAP004840-PA-like protein [Anopheles sinensis]|uniref:AGAP004840-PA-like protein n=1 Tax=Anopheles sinensis TaxID=74873 RepID=A0A084VUE4_ANOSI|nr:AGAP004840-PA-like protein [Anopheles sinensis]